MHASPAAPGLRDSPDSSAPRKFTIEQQRLQGAFIQSAIDCFDPRLHGSTKSASAPKHSCKMSLSVISRQPLVAAHQHSNRTTAARCRSRTLVCCASQQQVAPLAPLKAAGAGFAAAVLLLAAQPAGAELNKYEAAAGGEFNIGTARQFGEADVKVGASRCAWCSAGRHTTWGDHSAALPARREKTSATRTCSAATSPPPTAVTVTSRTPTFG
jgi:hypothetical protein